MRHTSRGSVALGAFRSYRTKKRQALAGAAPGDSLNAGLTFAPPPTAAPYTRASSTIAAKSSARYASENR